jgi:uncharacterized protein
VTLEQFFSQHPKAALAFSGGVDSAYLLWAGLQAGAEVWPYFVKTPFQPQFELEDAYRLCEQLDADLIVLDYDILSDETVPPNPPDRCYHCKRWMFSKLKRYAASEGFSLLIDGTNASDHVEDRPGMRALNELEVRSPLRECGLTKERIRALSRQAGLFTWDKPSYACLATRFPTGQIISRAGLEKVERGEAALAGLGLRDFRLRLTEGGAKLQVAEDQLSLVLERRREILSALGPDFSEITLDLRPRVPID